MKFSLQTPLLVTLLALGGCNSNPDASVNEHSATEPGSLSPALADDAGVGIDHDNYEDVLDRSLYLLRGSYYEDLHTVVGEISALWENYASSVTGKSTYRCSDSGSVVRKVTDAPVFKPNRVPVLTHASTLAFSNCKHNELLVDGLISINWRRSSPARLGSDSTTLEYDFKQVTFNTVDVELTITGTYSRRVSVGGIGDGYRLVSSIEFAVSRNKQQSISIFDASYRQTYSHTPIALSNPQTPHEFSESGNGRVVLPALTADISISPTIEYLNEMEARPGAIGVTHTNSFATGGIQVEASNSSVTVAPAVSPNVVTISITDPGGQVSIMDQAWQFPARCLILPEFNYQGCVQ